MAEPLSIELVEMSCTHLVPRPPGWRDGGVPVGPFDLQAKMLEYARELGTPYYRTALLEVAGIRRTIKQPVLLCPDCDERTRRLLAASEHAGAAGPAHVGPVGDRVHVAGSDDPGRD